MAINKEFYGVKATAHCNGSQVFSGLIEELYAFLAQEDPVDNIIIYDQEDIPSVQMDYEEFLLLIGDPTTD